MSDLILAIDNGTQSVRALLFDMQGNLIAKQQLTLDAYYSSKPGWAEQDVDYFWQSLSKCCIELWQQPEVVKNNYQNKVLALAVTTQRGTVVNLDKQGKPLRPAILWLDQRIARRRPQLPWYWRLLFSIVGQSQAIRYFQSKAQANWLAYEQPDIWQKTDKFLLLSGYLNYRLTGKFIDSIGNIVGYLPFDYKRQQWAKKNDWKWRALSITPDMLPELIAPGTTIGTLSKEAQTSLGITRALPVIAAASDKACEVLGAGCIDPATAHISYGTTATLNTNNYNYIEPQVFIPPFPSAIPHQFNSEVMVYRGFWMVNWFKREFGQAEITRAKSLKIKPEQLFDDLVKQVPPGAMGLMLQPYWSPGIKNLEAKGAIIGFGDVHTRAHIYRAILEGLAYALKEGADKLEKRQKQKIKRLVVSGGGSQSDAAMQLTADIFNLTAYRPKIFEASGLGAAICAAVGLGQYKSFEHAVKKMTRVESAFTPQPEHVGLYHQLYQQVYLQMYKKLKPIYQRIKEITGYPE